jgi:hypothetical protein
VRECNRQRELLRDVAEYEKVIILRLRNDADGNEDSASSGILQAIEVDRSKWSNDDRVLCSW